VNSLPIALLALVLALSGCSSSPSIEDQTKLIEYEKCLEFEIARWEARQSVYRQYLGYSTSDKQVEESIYESRIIECQDFRP